MYIIILYDVLLQLKIVSHKLFFPPFRYEQLIIEEGVVYQEVLAFERRIDSWSTQDHTHMTTPYGTVRGVSAAEGVPQAVTTFEVYSDSCNYYYQLV